MSSGSWLITYRATDGSEMTTEHPSRDAARDVMVDSLFYGALLMWDQALARPARDQARAGFAERGDRMMHHAARLMETTDGEFLINLSGGRRWLLVEASSVASVSSVQPLTPVEGESWM
jgi:hypothetical protein